MTLLRNDNAPTNGPGGLFWETPKHEVDVDPDLASELLRIPGAGFVEVIDAKAAKQNAKDAQDAIEFAEELRKEEAERLAHVAEVTLQLQAESDRRSQTGQEQVQLIAPTSEVAPDARNALTEPAPDATVTEKPAVKPKPSDVKPPAKK